MTILAEVFVSGASTVLGPTLARLPEGTLTQRYQATGETFTVAAEGFDYDELEDALAEDPTVRNPRVIADLEGHRIYRIDVAVDRPVISEFTSGLDVQVTEARGEDGGWWMQLRLPERETLKVLLEEMEGHDIDVRVHNLYAQPDEDVDVVLTPAQREALVTAYELGYFERPKDASLEDVARELGISTSAAGGRISRATKTVVEELFVDPT